MLARELCAIWAGSRDSRRHSTSSFSENVVVVETTYQMLEVLLLQVRLGDGLTSSIENNNANFSGEISASKLSGMSFIRVSAKKGKVKSRIRCRSRPRI